MLVLKKLGMGLASALMVTLPVLLLTVMPWTVLLACIGLLAIWLVATRVGRQTASVTRMGLATLAQRLGSVAVVVIGVAGVVGVLIALLAIGMGFEKTLKSTGTEDTVLVLSTGAKTEMSSSLSREVVSLVTQAPQIMKDTGNRPLISAEQLLLASLPKEGAEREASVAMRGVGEQIWQIRPYVRILSGRRFTTGLRELLVGRDAQAKYAGLRVGDALNFGGQPWNIVGTFDSGDAHNSELWSDASVMASTYRLGSSVNSLTLRLVAPSIFDSLTAEFHSDPRLQVEVQTTRQYYERQSEQFTHLIRIVGVTIGALMALGAVFGALNATLTAIVSRSREIATLRALGFRNAPVVISILIEIMLLAAVGASIGAAVAWAVFDGFTASTTGAGGQVVFAFDVSPTLLWNGLKWALAIAFIGGVLPAVRAARMPIALALREL
jgi:putative ABC transport system permease protein